MLLAGRQIVLAYAASNTMYNAYGGPPGGAAFSAFGSSPVTLSGSLSGRLPNVDWARSLLWFECRVHCTVLQFCVHWRN